MSQFMESVKNVPKTLWHKIKNKCVRTAKKLKHIRVRDYIVPTIFWLIWITWCVMFIFLLSWCIMGSFKKGIELRNSPNFFPEKFQWDNYRVALENMVVQKNGANGVGKVNVPFIELIWNTLLFALGTPFWAILFAAMASYVCVKFSHFKWLSGFYALTIITSYVSFGTSLAESIRFLDFFNLYDSMIGMWIFSSGAFGSMFLLYWGTWKGISWSYAEAAQMDGASNWYIFWRIMLPMTKGIFFALYIGKFIALWGDWQVAISYLPSYRTLAYAAWRVQYIGGEYSNLNIQLAGLTIILLPIIVLFAIFRKKLMNAEFRHGGLKG